MRQHELPAPQFEALLSAFEQDVTTTRYATRRDLLDYCNRSANPVGRLLLHLYGVADVRSLERSDAICTALQLINFWQDLSIDLRRGRIYLPLSDCQRFAVKPDDLLARRDSSAMRALVADACRWAEQTMSQGAPLAATLPGRLGWELRLVVQGGLRVLRKISRLDHATLLHRPRLRARDALPILWHAALM
jgi:squalene synthase HpnC